MTPEEVAALEAEEITEEVGVGEAVTGAAVTGESLEAISPSKVWETISGLSWLWVTLAIVVVGAIAYVFLRKKA